MNNRVNQDTRIAILETNVSHIVDSLNRIELKLERLDNGMKENFRTMWGGFKTLTLDVGASTSEVHKQYWRVVTLIVLACGSFIIGHVMHWF